MFSSGRPPALALVGALCLACQGEPPGAAPAPEPSAVIEVDTPAVEPAASATPEPVLGTLEDSLPFEPSGLTLASRAWRTWVYTDVGAKRTRYGYLRAGAVTAARGPALVNDGCAGGWYRVNPRGFVCLGKGATLEQSDPIVAATAVRPVRGQGLPYAYTLAGDTPPLRYFKLPTREEMETSEGKGVIERAQSWRAQPAQRDLAELLGEPGAPPDYLAEGRALQKPWGVVEHLHFATHAGRAAPDSGFALQRVFEWQGRLFGQTTENDIIALDRTRPVRPSAFRGAELGPEEDLPVAVVESYLLQRFRMGDGGAPRADGTWKRRDVVKLTGRVQNAFHETRDGFWLPGAGARVIARRTSFPSFATGDRKWIDVSISDQTLVAYEGTRAVYATLVSTGRGGMGDPEKTFATPRGTFMVVSKHVTATMDGADDASDSYNLLDVPFVQYFHKGYALHGTYWHDDFGRVRSHGCINLAPLDAAWLFEWTDPTVPPDWHSVLNKDRGTVVNVRP